MENRTFILHWLDGSDETVSGTDITDAADKADITISDIIRALDYYEEIEK